MVSEHSELLHLSEAQTGLDNLKEIVSLDLDCPVAASTLYTKTVKWP